MLEQQLQYARDAALSAGDLSFSISDLSILITDSLDLISRWSPESTS
jgi:hypothetical protein